MTVPPGTGRVNTQTARCAQRDGTGAVPEHGDEVDVERMGEGGAPLPNNQRPHRAAVKEGHRKGHFFSCVLGRQRASFRADTGPRTRV